jgi:hypothetical protein
MRRNQARAAGRWRVAASWRAAGSGGMRGLLVVGPHSEHFDRVFIEIHLVNESVQDVDASRIGSGEISDEFFERRRILEGIVG